MTPPDSDETRICGHTACPEWGCVVKSDSGEREALAEHPCPHARPTWRMCPHCLDLGGTTLSVAAHIVASSEIAVSLPLPLAQRILAALERWARMTGDKECIALAAELRARLPR